MPVYKDKKRNTWYVSFKKKDTITQEFNTVLKRGFQTKHEALEWENKAKTDEKISNKSTFRDILNLQLKSMDATDTTIYMKTHFLDKHFPYMDSPIEKVSRNQLLEWRNNLKEKGLATRTMNRGIGYIKSLCAFANKVYSIPDNSVILNSYKLQPKDKQEMQVWDVEEFNKFISCVDLEVYKIFYTFLYWTGCRRGEAIALCKDDIKGNIININKSMRYAKYGFKTPKTEQSKRKIQIDKELQKMLQPLIKMANPFIFGGEHPLNTTQIEKHFNQAILKSGVKRIRIHDLRHSHATLLINNGVNIVAVSKRLGHSTINQTLKTYTHLLDETNESLLDSIEKIKNT